MTVKEAATVIEKYLRCRKEPCNDVLLCSECDLNTNESEQDEAFKLAIEALAKQIPKKPVMGYTFGEKIREVIKRTDPERAESKTECCPVCGRTLGVSQFVKTQTGLRVGDPHCKRCGQAIDWTEDEG